MTRGAPFVLALLAAACGSVSHRVYADVPAPRTIAVLPFAGPAAPGVCEAARALVHSRLRSRGYLVPELAWVDRVLAERGWLRDPAAFDPAPLPLPEVAAALAVDAVLVATGVHESSFNVVLLRRHAVGGRVALTVRDGRDHWRADHAASTFGGFLLTSGQVFTELAAQGAHRTPMATLALVDEFTADVVGTLPMRDAAPPPAGAPALVGAAVRREPRPDGSQRVVVTAQCSPGAVLRFDLVPSLLGVPMVATAQAPDRHEGARELPPGAPVTGIVVHAADAFGRTASTEVAW